MFFQLSAFACVAFIAPIATAAISAQLTTSIAGPGSAYGYTSLGCFPDSISSRVLRGASFSDPTSFDLGDCTTFCNERGFQYVGIEFGRECFCDWKIHDNPPRAPQSECNTICTGVNDTYCGGPDRIQIFTRDPAFPRPTAPLTVNGYFLSGCYTDNPHVRTLERRINLAGGMTIGKCTVACRSAGFTRAGVEFGDECFCGNTIRDPGQLRPMEHCDMRCAGDSSQLCGAADRIIIYIGALN